MIELSVGLKLQLADDLIWKLWGVAIDFAKFLNIALTELYLKLIPDF